MNIIKPHIFDLIAKAVTDINCTFFLGSYASITPNNYSPPTVEELCDILRTALDIPSSIYKEKNLAKLSLFYETEFGRANLYDILKGRIDNISFVPSKAQKLIAKIVKIAQQKYFMGEIHKLPMIVTTNYDLLMERALDDEKVKYQTFVISIYNNVYQKKVKIQDNKIILFKYHGTIEDKDTIVITEHDYIEHISKILSVSRIPSEITQNFNVSTLLFLGYSLEDWTFRILLRTLFVPFVDDKSDNTYYSVQLNPEPTWAEYLKTSFNRTILTLNSDLDMFVDKLCSKIEKNHGWSFTF